MSELGRNLRAAREAAGASLAELSRRTHYSKALLGLLETGKRAIAPQHVTAYAKALGVPVDHLYRNPEPAAGEHEHLTPDRSAPLDSDYVESLRVRTGLIVDLDFQLGGDQASDVALPLFRSVRRKIGTSQRDPSIVRDLYAAAGELAEITGWFLYDAGQHDLAMRVDHESLHLSRLAGDRRTELLTLQNMSLLAGDLARPVEALRIAQMVLETSPDLSPRLQALFRIREARALALLGDRSAAEDTFDQARSRYLDGVRDDDPAWAWWINDQELAWHEAMIRADLADAHAAVDALQASIEYIPGREVRRRYNHLANLLHQQARAAAWREAAATAESIGPFVDEVRSTRSANTLLTALDTLDLGSTPSVREASGHLRGLLADAGYVKPRQ
jgi:transcriptional regulator with XRE-family HTH domain